MAFELSDIITHYISSYLKFSTFDNSGLLTAAYGITTFYIFGYLAARGKFDNPHQIAFDGLWPAVVVVLFLALIGVPDLLKGMALFAVYYATIRLTSTMSTQDFLRIVLYITVALGISAFLTKPLAFLYLMTVYVVYYIQGNMRIKQKREDAKKNPKPKEEKKETKPVAKEEKVSDSLWPSIKIKKK